MRWLVGVIVMVGCSSPTTNADPNCGALGEQCDDQGVGNCNDDCTLIPVEATIRWSFSTLAGDVTSTCVPGFPEVVVELESSVGYGGAAFATPCAPGEAQHSATGFGDVKVSSTTDHEYSGVAGSDVDFTGPLPIVVIYTDVGSINVRWLAANTSPIVCDPPTGFSRLRILLDGVVANESACSLQTGAESNARLVVAGLHTLVGEGLDQAGNVLATSSPVDVMVLAGATIDVSVIFPP